MKTNIIKFGFLLVGTAGLIILAPKKVQLLKNCSIIQDILSRTKTKIEPEKINFC